MLRLVNQLLDFRKIQNKKMKVLVEKTELVSQLQKIMESFHLIAKEKRIDFQLQTNTDKIYAWVDRDKFEKIFFNLLSNAFKYTPNGKKVTVNMITGSEQVTISVSDEGIGIAPEKQQSLFYRFETLAQYNILQPSSGIGLSLVRELIELHHGNIQVKSEPGSGSEFIVTLPKEEKAFADDQQAEFIYPTVTIIHRRYKLLKKIRIVHPSRQHTQRMKIKPTQRMKKLPFLLSKTTMNYVISYGISCQRLTLFSKQQMERRIKICTAVHSGSDNQ